MASVLTLRVALRRLFGVALLSAAAGSAVDGQTLGQVDAHLQEGRLQEARRALLEWEMANPDPGRADRQRSLWLRGLLTLDPEEASSSYARLLVEYPGGPFTDRALLRLALAADLRGDTEEAAVHYAQLARDHPTSPLQDEAERWLRAHPEATGAASGRGQEASAGPSGEGTEGRAAATDGVSGADPDGSAGYTVQLGAFTERRWADQLVERLQKEGFDPRVVRLADDTLVRVRIGRYRTRAEAVAARDQARAAGFEASLSTDARRERTAG